MGAAQALLLAVHIAAALVATAAGGLALAARKGSPVHRRAGQAFVAAMFVMYGFGIVYGLVDPTPDPSLVVSAAIGAYLVATAWQSGRRRDARFGRFEAAGFGLILACLSVSLLSLAPAAPRFLAFGPATVPNIVIAGLAVADDFAFLIRGRLSGNGRILRHVWRIGLAMLMVTFATFAGEQVQRVLPGAIRGSIFLIVPPLAVLGVTLFWLVRLRFAKALKRRFQKPERKAETLAPSRSTA